MSHSRRVFIAGVASAAAAGVIAGPAFAANTQGEPDPRSTTAFVRPGWEMNIPTDTTCYPGQESQWIAAFRHCVDSIRATAPNVRIVFNPNLGPANNDGSGAVPVEADKVWPGDPYVDLVGVDAYDHFPPYRTQADWDTHYNQAYGWKYWEDFTSSHGKQFCVPEWGLHKDGGGDNPAYIQFMYDHFVSLGSDLGFEAYFDERASYIQNSLIDSNPNSRATYRTNVARI